MAILLSEQFQFNLFVMDKSKLFLGTLGSILWLGLTFSGSALFSEDSNQSSRDFDSSTIRKNGMRYEVFVSDKGDIDVVNLDLDKERLEYYENRNDNF